MNIGILGTGIVGRTLGNDLTRKGHKVCLGSRTLDNVNAAEWVRENGASGSQGRFDDAAKFADTLVFLAVKGEHALDALEQAGAKNLKRKILIDVSNPLDFSRGMPPRMLYCNTDSLGERVQSTLPDTKVVKALNTLNCEIMLQPDKVPGEHDLFICGNDPVAKQSVSEFLESFGWNEQNIIDLGDITSSRGTEMVLPLWIQLMGALGTPKFNFHIARAR